MFQGVFGGWYIGAGCMNPARVFGPAVVNGDFNYHWIWWAGEMLGAAFATVVESSFFAPIIVQNSKISPLWWMNYTTNTKDRSYTYIS